MPGSANYTVIFDKSRPDGFSDLTGVPFTIPNSCDLKSKPILMFTIEEETEDDIRFEVSINEQVVYHKTFDDEYRYATIHEVLKPGVIRHGENRISFRVIRDPDDFIFVSPSDAVLWWHEAH